MFRVERIVNKPISSNSFVIWGTNNKDCLIIDPGSENCFDLLTFLSTKELIPTKIILTHHHFDHIWGVNQLRNIYPKIELVCSDVCSEFIINRKRNCSIYYDGEGFELKDADITFASRFSIPFQSKKINMEIAPGHSKSSILIQAEKHLFTGDTLIYNLKTIVKLPSASVKDLHQTLDLIKSYQGNEMIVHAGHGESFKLDNYDINRAL